MIDRLRSEQIELHSDPVLARWERESSSLPIPWPDEGGILPIRRTAGDPAHVSERIEFAKSVAVQDVLGSGIKWAPEDLYGYRRAFTTPVPCKQHSLTVLDPTSGGGSIPFEALRLGYKIIANELNPVATSILYATLDYPARFGLGLVDNIERWGVD